MIIKTNIVKIILTSAFFMSFAHALPPCPDCDALKAACVTRADAEKVKCVLDVETTKAVRELKNDTVRDVNYADCEADHEFGSAGLVACKFIADQGHGLVQQGIDSWYYLTSLGCASAHHTDKTMCESDRQRCAIGVANDRANCVCE